MSCRMRRMRGREVGLVSSVLLIGWVILGRLIKLGSVDLGACPEWMGWVERY